MTCEKYKYQIIIFPEQQLPFEVEASSTIEACLQVQKKLSFSMDGSPLDFGLLELSPMRDVWLVMRTSPYEYCDFLHVEQWDGRLLRSFTKVPLGNNIVQAVRTARIGFNKGADNDNERYLSL